MLSESVNELLIGSLLGDACIEQNGRYWRIRFDHSWKETEYVLWKYQHLKSIASSPPRRIDVDDKRTGKCYRHVRFDTRSLEVLGDYRKAFYSDGKKIIPHNIGDLLNSTLSLAVWYMDDGHRRTDCDALRINTNAYSRGEVEKLVSVLRQKFGIKSRVHRVVKDQYVIYIPAHAAKAFCNLIRPHVLPAMEYKLL